MKLVALVAAVVLAAGCSASAGDEPTTSELTVFAASSLGAAFTTLERDFERDHPGVDVVLNFGSSTDLAGQIASEGTADVFAAASDAAMDTVAAQPGITDRTDIATNHLVIITPPDNPADVRSLDSLTRPTVQLIVGAEGVPVGDYTRQMLAAAGIDHPVLTNVVSYEPDDASIVAKVQSGEADAGIVYTSDIPTTAGTVSVIEIPADVNVTATYPIAVVAGTDQPTLAAAFLDLVRSPHGQVVLDSHGFGPPPAG